MNILPDVDGWLFEGEALLLARLAGQVQPPSVVVEIGSYQGRSTIVMALALQPKVHLHAIDPHQPSPGDPFQFSHADRDVFLANLERYGVVDKVVEWLCTSAEAARQWTNTPIGLLFIDGAHHYEAVRDDLANWLPKLAPDGLIAMHDENWPGVMQAVAERTDLQEVAHANITRVYRVKR